MMVRRNASLHHFVDGEADPIDGDGAFRGDEGDKFMFDIDDHIVAVAVVGDGADGADSIDMPLDDVPSKRSPIIIAGSMWTEPLSFSVAMCLRVSGESSTLKPSDSMLTTERQVPLIAMESPSFGLCDALRDNRFPPKLFTFAISRIKPVNIVFLFFSHIRKIWVALGGCSHFMFA
jgi:hypothetical protein